MAPDGLTFAHSLTYSAKAAVAGLTGLARQLRAVLFGTRETDAAERVTTTAPTAPREALVWALTAAGVYAQRQDWQIQLPWRLHEPLDLLHRLFILPLCASPRHRI